MIVAEVDDPAIGITGMAGRCGAAQRRMNSISIVVIPEVQQLPFEVPGAPKRDLVQELSPYRVDQSFDERMRERHLGYRFDLRHAENAEIRLPAMELEQRVVIAAVEDSALSPATD